MSDLELPKGCEVAYFVELHLGTVIPNGQRPSPDGTRIYLSEGKPRPMFVLAAPEKREWGRRWFAVLPITTKGHDERGKVRSKMLLIGDCIVAGKESFLRLEPKRLPENMLHAPDNRSPICIPCDQLAFRNVIKLVDHWARGGTIAKVFATHQE